MKSTRKWKVRLRIGGPARYCTGWHSSFADDSENKLTGRALQRRHKQELTKAIERRTSGKPVMKGKCIPPMFKKAVGDVLVDYIGVVAQRVERQMERWRRWKASPVRLFQVGWI